MHSIPRACALLTLALASVWPSGPLWAQESQRQLPRGRAQAEEGTELPAGLRFADLKLGPFYLQPRVALADLGYDTNVLGTPAATEVRDFRTTLSGGTRLIFPFRAEHSIQGDAQVDYLWFSETEALRTFNGTLDLRYKLLSDRWDIDVYTRYIDARRGQLDLIEIGNEVVDPSYEIFGRVRERGADVGARVRALIGSRFVLEPRGLRRVIRFKDDAESGLILSTDLDRTEESLGAFVGYRVTSRTTVGFDGDYQNNDYEAPGNPRQATTHRLAGKLELDSRAPLHGAILLGLRDLTPAENGLVGYRGAALAAEMAFAPGGIMEITLAGDRDAYPSFWFDSIYFLRQGGATTVLFQAQRSFALGAELSVHEHSYSTEATLAQLDGSLLTARRRDLVYRALGRLDWNLSRANRMTFRMGWIERDSNFDVAKTDGFVAGGGFSLTY